MMGLTGGDLCIYMKEVNSSIYFFEGYIVISCEGDGNISIGGGAIKARYSRCRFYEISIASVLGIILIRGSRLS